MDYLQRLIYCEIISTLSFIGVAYLIINNFHKRKFIKSSSYQKEIQKYFENMRWYGFKDGEIADMLHDMKSHKELKIANSKAFKERKGKI